jgi:predicted negative regulator of RcsB-dependent stress response
VLSHQQATTYILIVAIIVAVAVFGWKTYTERQTVKASAAFDDAMKTFQAPTGATGMPPVPGQPIFNDDAAKYTAAAPKFEDVAKKYGHTRPGQLANYYSGLCLVKLGKDAEAKPWLEAAASGGEADFASMARFELAQLDDRTGQSDQAVKIYQELMAKPTTLLPKPVTMLALAEHYGQKNPTEAAKLYAQIKSEYPDTAIATQADQEMALLPGKS